MTRKYYVENATFLEYRTERKYIRGCNHRDIYSIYNTCPIVISNNMHNILHTYRSITRSLCLHKLVINISPLFRLWIVGSWKSFNKLRSASVYLLICSNYWRILAIGELSSSYTTKLHPHSEFKPLSSSATRHGPSCMLN